MGILDTPGIAMSRLSRLLRPPNTIALFGDSITWMNFGASTGYLYTGTRGFWTHAAPLLRRRLRLVARAGTYTGGVSGERTDQILARVQQDVLDLQPGYCHVLAGTNDMIQNIPLAVAQANMLAILDTLDRAGIRAIVGTILPKSGATTAQLRWTVGWNNWIKGLPASRPNLIVVDYHAVTAQANGDWLTGNSSTAYTADGTHPSTGGAARMGRALFLALDPIVPKLDVLSTSNVDDPSSGVALPNIAGANPLLTGTGGALANGMTGVVATGWSGTSSGGTVSNATMSKVARTDQLPGEWQQVTVTTAATATRLLFQVGNTVYAAGDWVQGECEFETDAGMSALSVLRLNVVCSGGGLQVYDYSIDPADSGTLFPYENQPRAGVFRTPRFQIPAGTTALFLCMDFTGIGTVRWGRAALRKG